VPNNNAGRHDVVAFLIVSVGALEHQAWQTIRHDQSFSYSLHGLITARRVTCCESLLAINQRPHPWRIGRRDTGSQNPANRLTIPPNDVVVIWPLLQAAGSPMLGEA